MSSFPGAASGAAAAAAAALTSRAAAVMTPGEGDGEALSEAAVEQSEETRWLLDVGSNDSSSATSSSSASSADDAATVAAINFVAYRVVANVIVAVGIVGNLINLIVLTRPKLKGVMYRYLLALAASNLMVLIMAIPALMDIGGAIRSKEYPVVFFQAHLEMPLLNSFMASSVYIIICMTVNRYISIYKPTQFQRIHTFRNAYLAILCSFVGGALLHVPLAFEYDVVPDCKGEEAESEEECNSFKAEANARVAAHPLYRVYLWASEALLRLGPIVTLTILNVLIIVRFHKIAMKREVLKGGAASAAAASSGAGGHRGSNASNQGGHLGGAASPSPYHYAPAAASVSVAHSSSSSGTGNNNRLSVSSHMVHNGGGGNNKLGVPISVVEDDGATSVVYKAIPANANAVSIAPDQTSTTFVSCSVATTQQQQQQQLQIQQQQQLAGASSPRAQSPSGGGGLASPSRLLHPTSSFRRGAGAGRGGPCRASSRRRRRGLHNPEERMLVVVLIAIVVLFVVCTTPAAFLSVLVSEDLKSRPWFALFRACANDLELLCFALNFFVYCLCSADIRGAFVDVLFNNAAVAYLRRKSLGGGNGQVPPGGGLEMQAVGKNGQNV